MSNKIESSTMSVVTVGSLITSLAIALTWGFTKFATKDELNQSIADIKQQMDVTKKEQKDQLESVSKEVRDQRTSVDSIRDNTTRIMTILEMNQKAKK